MGIINTSWNCNF